MELRSSDKHDLVSSRPSRLSVHLSHSGLRVQTLPVGKRHYVFTVGNHVHYWGVRGTRAIHPCMQAVGPCFPRTPLWGARVLVGLSSSPPSMTIKTTGTPSLVSTCGSGGGDGSSRREGGVEEMVGVRGMAQVTEVVTLKWSGRDAQELFPAPVAAIQADVIHWRVRGVE